jgi:hypothetical protein
MCYGACGIVRDRVIVRVRVIVVVGEMAVLYHIISSYDMI